MLKGGRAGGNKEIEHRRHQMVVVGRRGWSNLMTNKAHAVAGSVKSITIFRAQHGRVSS